jgi:hypothetical protein
VLAPTPVSGKGAGIGGGTGDVRGLDGAHALISNATTAVIPPSAEFRIVSNDNQPPAVGSLQEAGWQYAQPVSRVLSDCSSGRSFLLGGDHSHPLAAYPRCLRRGGPPLTAYLALLQPGFTMPHVLPHVR